MRWAPLLLLAACSSSSTKVKVTHEQDAGKSTGIHVDPHVIDSGRIVIEPLTRRALHGDLAVPAELVPSEVGQADVGSLVAGRVNAIVATDGEAVKKGQVLAWIDAPDATRTVADSIRAKARLTAATRHLDRQLALQADRATSANAVDEARLEVESARAEANASYTLLSGLGISDGSGARVPIKSPIDGVMVERMVVLGAPVAPEKTMFRVMATGRVVADARWTDPLAKIPSPGSIARIIVRERDAGVCMAHVTAAVSLIDERTRSRKVRVVPTAPCEGLVAGGYAEVAFDSGGVIALALPRAAVIDVRGASTVFVALADPGSFEPRVVVVGTTSADDVSIVDGVREGERVVTIGAVLLKGEMLRADLQ